MNKKINFIFSVVCIGLISCQAESPKLVPQEKVKPQAEKLDLGKEGIVTQLDVLFVVDDSGSMSAHQQNLSNNIDLFVNEFSKSSFVDYHVGVTTSSFADCGSRSKGCKGVLVGSPRWVERTTPNGSAQLRQNILVGIEGSGREMFFSPVMSALTSPLSDNENKGFFRPRAHLAIVFVTDAEEQSNVDPAAFTQFLKSLKGGPDKFSIYAAYIPVADSRCPRSGEYPPQKFEQFFSQVNAVTVGLCDPQFGKKLAEVGKDLFRRIARVMYLARTPIRDSIKVKYGSSYLPQDYRKGWTFDPSQNALVFGDEIDWNSQPPGSNLDVEYDPAR